MSGVESFVSTGPVTTAAIGATVSTEMLNVLLAALGLPFVSANAPATTRIVAAVVEEESGVSVMEYAEPAPLNAEVVPPEAVMSPEVKPLVDSLVVMVTTAVSPMPRRVDDELIDTVGTS
jgi:hypothetical protein